MPVKFLVTRGYTFASEGGDPVPDTPTLSAVDNGDGTGGVATIAGSTAGSTNTVMYMEDGDSVWTLGGSRTGNGTVPLALDPGYYWLVANSTLGGPSVASNVVRLAVTDEDDSVHYRSAVAIRARLGLLSMPLLTGGIVHQTLPDENTADLPAVIVHYNEGELIGAGTNARDDIGYPVHVLLCDRKTTALGEVESWRLSYRQRMMRALRHQELSGVPEIWNVEIAPNLVVDENLPTYQYFVSGFTAICWSREVRG